MNHLKWLRCTIGMLALVAACAAPRDDRATLDAIAERYVRTALQLARHQPSLVEQWRGDAAWQAGARRPVAETREDIRVLIGELEAVDVARLAPDHLARVDYLRRQLAALDVAARRLLGERIAFGDEVVAAFGMPLPVPDQREIGAAKAALEQLLPGAGALGARQAAFRHTVTVPPAREADVLRAALDACRARTREHLALPDDETVELVLGVDSPWDGFARYQGNHRSRIEISGHSALDPSRALRLACHEAYPGHHVQSVLVDTLAASSGRSELRLQPAFGPHLLIAEGAAEAGTDLAFPHDDRVRLYREVLLPRAGLPAARAETIAAVEDAVFTLEQAIPPILADYLDSRLSRQDALDALARDAAVMEPDALLAFAERQRTRAVTYVLGRRLVSRWLATQDGDPWPHLASIFATRGVIIEPPRHP